MKENSKIFIDTSVNVSKKDLPLSCPKDSSSVWVNHPKVYLNIPITGIVKCPYCGTIYKLNN